MFRIERLVAPEAIEPLAPLWERALASGVWLSGPLARIKADLEIALSDPHFIILAGRAKGEPKALAIGVLPASTLMPFPQVPLFYSEGPRRLTRALAEAVLYHFRENGHKRLRTINRSGAPDEVWARALVPGAKMRQLGSYVEFDYG